MHTALTLRSRAADLKSQLSGVQLVMKFCQRAATNVLHAMLHTLSKVGNVRVYGALVLHCPRDSLRNLHSCFGAKIPVVRAFLHRIDGTHATIALEPHPISKEVLTGSFFGSRQEAA